MRGSATIARAITTRKLVPLESVPSGIPGSHRPCFINSQGPAVEVLAVDFGNSLIAALLHFHKTETFGAASVTICDDMNRFNQTCLREQVLEFTFRRLKRQISNVEFLFHVITF
jgi:hypothetical protein